MNEQPYIIKQIINEIRIYNPKFGDEKICQCGHTYYRHFDFYEDSDQQDVGCKYCGCDTFVPTVSASSCKHKVPCPYCNPTYIGILRDSRDGRACHCARLGDEVGKAFCGEPSLVGNLCYDHAKRCDICDEPYDPNCEHVCKRKIII